MCQRQVCAPPAFRREVIALAPRVCAASSLRLGVRCACVGWNTLLLLVLDRMGDWRTNAVAFEIPWLWSRVSAVERLFVDNGEKSTPKTTTTTWTQAVPRDNNSSVYHFHQNTSPAMTHMEYAASKPKLHSHDYCQRCPAWKTPPATQNCTHMTSRLCGTSIVLAFFAKSVRKRPKSWSPLWRVTMMRTENLETIVTHAIRLRMYGL